MADNRKSYNAVIREFNRKHGLTQAQARVAWRTLRDRLDKTPRLVDLKKHPRITTQEVNRAPARERALRAAKTRAANKAKAAPKKSAPPPQKPPKPKAKAMGAGAGAGSAAGPAPPVTGKIPPEFEEFEGVFYGGEEFDEEDDY